jgi:hypothetical protein
MTKLTEICGFEKDVFLDSKTVAQELAHLLRNIIVPVLPDSCVLKGFELNCSRIRSKLKLDLVYGIQ